MKPLGGNLIVKMVFTLNLLFWIVYAVDVRINAVPFADHPPDFEEELPAFKFVHWAAPVDFLSPVESGKSPMSPVTCQHLITYVENFIFGI
jgi:hypothetical protein